MSINRLDITGQRYGKLVAISQHHIEKDLAYWECKCDCGKTKIVALPHLRREWGTRSCGCLRGRGSKGRASKIDLTGHKIGELTVLKRAEDSRYARWVCKCSCGNIVTRYQTYLRNPVGSKTCGHDGVQAHFRAKMERLITDQGMICDACHQFKSIACFSQDKRQKLITYRTSCNDCSSEERHARLIQENFDLSPEDYEKKLSEQDGKCEICGKARESGAPKLCVDHDHSSGNVRGLLCHSCNTGLGNFKDSPNSLAKAISYLAKYSQVEETMAKATG